MLVDDELNDPSKNFSYCIMESMQWIRPGVFNLLNHATPLTDFGMLATPHNDNVKIELRR